ncbi:cytochrome P450 [Actinoalloteichus hymeniacidonis]|uniref:cytochrome P450 n=1 Tax=Actinoalloteichus hymeniacidonis TaxID=340345 RepID=UPI000853276D|nr:cytochrome P450 [Actinoalloteichus hymeniacidonis]MBB5911069.1 unspecific monooxygenase [Actinoalloteichus hymeniacidonis]
MTAVQPAQQPFDPADPAFLADPYPTFAALREAGPVHWHEGMGLHLAVTHGVASAVLRHRSLGRIWVDAEPAAEFGAFNLLHQTSLLENEPPTHTRLRRLVSSAFGRGHVERLRPWVEQLADDLVAGLAATIDETGSGDVLAEVAAPLPVAVIAQLLGVPEADRGLLQPWSNAIVKMYEFGLAEARRREAEQASAEFVAYLRELIALRRNDPGDDLVSDLVAVTDADGARLTEDELIGTAVLLLMAGHEASVNVVGNGVRALLQNPQQWQRLLDDPALLPTAADELIRYDSPLQLFERTAVEDVEIAGVRIREGEKIAALLGSAARDPEVFAEPDRLDVGRDPNPHIGFGLGIHYCLGAPLARIEVIATLDALRRRLPTLSSAGTPRRRGEFVIRGLHDLPVSR